MAMADYYLCDICESKCFYDANLNWEWAERDNPIPEDEMVRGKHLRLGYCGDMAAICLDCAKTHEVRVVEIAAPQPVSDDARDADIGAVVWKFIDRMGDHCEVDTAEKILDEFVAAVMPLILEAISYKHSHSAMGSKGE